MATLERGGTQSLGSNTIANKSLGMRYDTASTVLILISSFRRVHGRLRYVNRRAGRDYSTDISLHYI